MLYKVPHCTGCVLASTRPHQLRCGDWDFCLMHKTSQMAGLIHTVGWLHVATVTNVLKNLKFCSH